MKVFRALMLSAALLCPLLAGAGPIMNGGFESGDTAGWIASGSISTAEAHSGSFSFEALSPEFVSQFFAPIDSASIASFSFWVKRLGGPFDSIQLSYSDGTQMDSLVDMVGGSNDWVQIDMLPFLVSGKSLTGFVVYGASRGPAFLDDFELVVRDAAVPEPATLLLLGIGLGGLALTSRRRASCNPGQKQVSDTLCLTPGSRPWFERD